MTIKNSFIGVAIALLGLVASNADASAASRHHAGHRATGHHMAFHASHRFRHRIAERHGRGWTRTAGFAKRVRADVQASEMQPATSGAQWTGNASFYSGSHRTAGGGFVGAATCAHRTLPFGTKVLVTNLRSGRQAVLTVNDRGPFVRGRIVDVSVGAANVLGMLHSGVAMVRVEVVAASHLLGG